MRAAAGVFVIVTAMAQQAPTGGSVEGRVINTVTGAGVPGASVTLFAAGKRYQASADVAGAFKIADVAPGNYRASAEKDGFTSAPPSFPFLTNSGYQIGASLDPVKVEIKLTPLSTFRGRVVDPDGKPLKGFEVNLIPNFLGSEVTDNEGKFAFEGVKPGSYTLSAKPPATLKPAETADGSRSAMVTTYYPSASEAGLAPTIAVRGDGDLDGYEIRMQTALVGRVRGMVSDEDGKPVAGAEVSLFPISREVSGAAMLALRAGGTATFLTGVGRRPCCNPEATVTSGKDGQFEFAAVPRGDWRVEADDTVRKAGMDASVGRSDADGLELRLAAPFKLTAALEWSGDDAARQALDRVSPVTLLDADRNEFGMVGMVDSGVVKFEKVFPGRYEALVRSGYLGRIFLGETEVTGQPFVLAADGPKLRVALKPFSGTVRGTVEKGEGATVILIPERPGQAAFGQIALCGPGGTFEMNEVSPGEYYAAAFDKIAGMPPSAAMLSLIPSRGTRVTVEEHAAATVTLTAIPAPR